MKKQVNPSQRARILAKTLDSEHNLTHNPFLVRFLETYIDCEATAHKLVRFYKRDKYNRTDASVILNVRKVANACAYYRLKLEKDEIYNLFRGGKGIRGKKTPRQLRNGYLHEKSRADAEEMEHRLDFLHERMRRWLTAVHAFMADLSESGKDTP